MKMKKNVIMLGMLFCSMIIWEAGPHSILGIIEAEDYDDGGKDGKRPIN
ncbi:MAG: hypothetical protein LBH19_13165 [Dysgonamonadaceae bacterium]|jgi:hypothetical protein|nr:hypothetical protein [Dysgonamonadaceae bacterium]